MGCGPTPSTYRPQHLNKQPLQRHDRGASSCRYCCKSPKLLGDNFLAIRRSDPRPPIFTVSITLPRSPVSLSSGDEVSHIFTRKSRLKPGEFLITSAKGLLQQNLPGADSCTAAKQRAYWTALVPPTIRGSRIVNVEPRPGSLSTVMSPPIIWQNRRLITSPSPVPPYLLAVVEEAWENSWKSLPICSAVIPIPVSATAMVTQSRPFACSWRASTVMVPRSVNLLALLKRFNSAWRSRIWSACIVPIAASQ